jgi:hypothetical protein
MSFDVPVGVDLARSGGFLRHIRIRGVAQRLSEKHIPGLDPGESCPTKNLKRGPPEVVVL